MTAIRSIAFGGGVQSMSMLALAAAGRIDFKLALFANTGDDSEDPLTLAYVRDIAVPFAAAHGIELVEVQKTIGGDRLDTIAGKIERTEKSEVIPVRSEAGGKPMSRSCTVDFKIEVMGRELKRRGAGPDNPATVAIGISLDEMGRASRAPRPWERIVYPLLGAPTIGELPTGWTRALRRTDCEAVIRAAGLPVPSKSSCYFCPFQTYGRWQDLRRNRPDLFLRAARIEGKISAKAGSPRYLTPFGVPLVDAIDVGVDLLTFDVDSTDDNCLSGGMCGT